MEITVLDAFNTPPKAVLAVHAGSVRRQARLEVNQPFIIPHQGSLKAGKVDVTLFQQIASHRLLDDGQPVCTIPVRKPDGSTTEVKIRVARAAEPEGVAPRPSSEGATKSYLDNHRLQQRIQTMIQEVLKEQPDDPYLYMLEQLKKCRAEQQVDGSAPEQQAEQQGAPPSLPEARSQLSSGPPTVPKQAPQALSPVQEPAKATAPVMPLAPSPPTAPKPPAGGPARPGGSPNRPGRTLKNKVDVSKKPKGHVQLISSSPQTQSQKEARATMRLLLRSAPCKVAMEESLRTQAQRNAAKSMTASIMGCAKERVVREMVRGAALKDITRAVINQSIVVSAVVLSHQYQKALTRYTACMAFRGAAKLMRGELALEDYKTGGRRQSLPMPIINLGGSCDWGNVLA